MIIDTSAVIAIMQNETPTEKLLDTMARAAVLGMGTPSMAELAMVLGYRLRRDAQDLVARFVQEFAIEPISFGPRHWQVASEAAARFGKGRHRAKLNFGDCMSYATAKIADLPLLYVGNDFGQTDIESALV